MLHQITSGVPRYTKPTRKGRGEGSGKGKTSGRGTKGAKARVGKYVKRGHEHGQTPIFRRFPKRGFSNFDFETRYHVVNVSDLERKFETGATIDAAALREAGLIPNMHLPVKVLGDGELTKRFTILAGWYSKSAHEKIGKSGGTAQNLKGQPFEYPKVKRRFPKPIGGAAEQQVKKKSKEKGESAPEGGPAPETPAAAAPTPAPTEQKPE
jgi:large subunit ribosomal protein L15